MDETSHSNEVNAPMTREADEDMEEEKPTIEPSPSDPRMLARMAPPPPHSTIITTGMVAQAAEDAGADRGGGGGSGGDDGDDSDMELTEEERQRRDLNRRPSYRRIFDELKDGADTKGNPDATGIRHIVTTNTGVIGYQTAGTAAVTSMIHDPAAGVQFQVVANSSATAGGQPSVITFNSPQPQQVRVSGVGASPGGGAATAFVTAGQIQRMPSLGALPTQGVVIQSPNPQQLAEDSTRKREMRLMKNREAAKECRRKKKEYVKCLENRVAVLEAQNKTLIEELKALKDLYCHKSVDNA